MDPRESPSRTGSDPVSPDHRPAPPVARWARSLARFFQVEAAGGVVLLLCTVAALVLANSPWAARSPRSGRRESG